MATALLREEHRTAAAAAAFILSIGAVSVLPVVGPQSTLIVTLSALAFAYLYAGS